MAKKRKTFGSKEGTPKDNREDKAMAKKRGMSMAAWENSAADKKHDGVRKFATGGMIDPAGPPAPMPAPRPNQMPNTMMQRNPMAQAPAMMPPRGQQNAMGRSIPRTEALRQWAERERAKTRDAAAGQLMQKGQLEAYGGADNYSKALLDAAGTTNANGVRVGSAGFQKEAAQKGYDALQGMDEYKKWGLDNYDWSKQGVGKQMKSGGPVQKMASGGAVRGNGCASKGLTKGRMR